MPDYPGLLGSFPPGYYSHEENENGEIICDKCGQALCTTCRKHHKCPKPQKTRRKLFGR